MTPAVKNHDESTTYHVEVAKKRPPLLKGPICPHFWEQPFFLYEEDHLISYGTTKRQKSQLN
jgi:hypothetical protein